MRSSPEVLIITRRDIVRVMTPADFLEAMDQAFRAVATGKASAPHPWHLPMTHGAYHAKGGSISLAREYVAVKVNGNFPGNPAKHGLPSVQGAIILADGSNGVLLAILDSIEVTLRRTAAASALAARLLARPDSQTMLVCGCGVQGEAHVTTFRGVLPSLQRFLLWDIDHSAAETLAGKLAGESGIDAEAVGDLKTVSISADVIACVTPATEPYLDADMVKPGAFIAAVGADNHHKNEIVPPLMAASTVVTDALHQCAEMGDLHHAIAAGCMTVAEVHAELGEVLVGAKTGRRSPEEIIIFDSTGTGLQDVAAAAVIYERCHSSDSIESIALGAA